MERLKRTSIRVILMIAHLCLPITVLAHKEALPFQTTSVPVVLSASKLAQPLTDAPAAVTIIDKALIEASGASQIAELFRLVPGMQVGYARGNFPVVAYQGLTSEFSQGVQVIIDGTSVYSPLFGGVLWNQLPIELEDIERIEIVRGPNSATFGANSYQSVISITTTHPTQQPTTDINYQLSNQHAERKFIRFAGAFENLDYRITIVDRKTEGYDNLPDDYSKQHVSSRIDLRVNNNNTLQLNLSAVDSLRQTQSPNPALVLFDPKRNRNESSQFAHLKWLSHINLDEHIRSQLSYQHFDGKDKYAIPFLPVKLDITGESSRWNADFEHTLNLNNNTRMVWGIGATYETVFAPFRLNTKQTKSNQRYRLFTNTETRLNTSLILNAGALFEYDQISGNHFSPRVAINYLQSANHSYRLSTTRAFRTPVITEEYRNSFIGLLELERSVGNLDAETIDSIEIGYHGLFSNNKLNADIRLFRNNYDKLINTGLGDVTLTIIDNKDSAHTKGLEVEINYRPNRSVNIHSAYAYTEVNHATNTLNNSIPKHNFNALLSYQLTPNWRTSAAYYYTSDMQYLSAQSDPQGQFQRLDLSVSKRFRLNSKKELAISLRTQLALDKNIDFHQQASADNRIFLQVEYRAR
ncbi:MAG: outer membrane receptor protein [Piscirickettsiaceae bacterium]|nr:MAG: outer membrane receptor protein [Piscirickettsiaceae bacterium]